MYSNTSIMCAFGFGEDIYRTCIGIRTDFARLSQQQQEPHLIVQIRPVEWMDSME